jgi:hypothetical protein
MAGTLTISTLSDGTNSTSATNLVKAPCVAWVNFNGTVATPSTIRGSYNVTSVTKNGTGDYTLNFTNALPNANYVVAGSAAKLNGGDTASNMRVLSRNGATAQTTSAVRVGVYYANTLMEDAELVLVAVISS